LPAWGGIIDGIVGRERPRNALGRPTYWLYKALDRQTNALEMAFGDLVYADP
jgi:hypothetical protein